MDFLLPLKNRFYVFKVISAIITVLTLFYIIDKNKLNGNKEVLLILILFLYAGNNFIRGKFLKARRDKWFFLSYVLSVLMLGYLTYETGFIVGMDLYTIILLIELIVFTGKLNRVLIVFNFIIYVTSYVEYIHHMTGTVSLNELLNVLLNFLFPCLILFLFRSVIAEKIKYENLSNELKEANITLIDNADKIEELTKTQERNRIAQELHDSIGHSLMALKMNLEYAENVLETKPDKAKEVIHKTQNITKDCVDNLRKVVSLLKDSGSVEQLRDAMNELFHNFKVTNRIKFHLEMEDSVELELPDIKNCIYKIVREAITNGIQHGNATIFNIDILNKSDKISLKIKNNGLENENIIKSNGITGMEERVNALGGQIRFTSAKENGFIIEAVIPKLEEES